MGVNHEKYDAGEAHTSSRNASCTTNCLAPVVHVLLKEGFGIDEGLMTTIHSYTATQKTVDGPSQEGLEGRPGRGDQHHPVTTGAAKAVGLVMPRGEGQAHRHVLPRADADRVGRRSDREDGEGDELQGNLRRDEEGERDVPEGHPGLHRRRGRLAATSSTTRQSSIFDAGSGIELNSQFFKLVSWYDNEWGYRNRCVDLLKYMIVEGVKTDARAADGTRSRDTKSRASRCLLVSPRLCGEHL